MTASSVPLTAIPQSEESDRNEWRQRLQRYFAHRKVTKTPLHIEHLTTLIIDDSGVWDGVLEQYGAELDPPYDQPPQRRRAETMKRVRMVGSRQWLHTDEMLTYWTKKLSRFYAHYVPEKSPEDIRKIVQSVEPTHWGVVWDTLIRKYGPEPLGQLAEHEQPSSRASDASSLGAFMTHEEKSAAAQLSRNAVIEQGYREMMKIRLSRHRTAVEKPYADLSELDIIVDGVAASKLEELWNQSVQECGPPVAGEELISVDKELWRRVLRCFETQLSDDEIDHVLSDHERRPGGINELLSILVAKHAEGAYRVSPRKYKLYDDLDDCAFWERRLKSYYNEKGVAMTPVEVSRQAALAAVTDGERMWRKVVEQFGEEDQPPDVRWGTHRVYWESRLRSMLHGVLTRREIATAFDSCNRQWSKTFSRLLSLHGVQQPARREVTTPPTAVRHAEDAMDGDSKPSVLHQRLQRASAMERDYWKRRITRFLQHNNPAKATPREVCALMERADKVDGGVRTLWRLLITKYGPEQAVSTADGEESHFPARRAVSFASEAKTHGVAADELHSPGENGRDEVAQVSSEEAELRFCHPYWRERFRDYCSAKELNRSDEEIVTAMNRYAARGKGFDLMWADLETRYGRYPFQLDGTMPDHFWKWAISEYAVARSVERGALEQDSDESPLSLPEQLYRLHALFGPHPRNLTVSELYREYLLARSKNPLVALAPQSFAPESSIAKRREHGSAEMPRRSREFWLKKIEEYRLRECPTMSSDLAVSLFESGEACCLPYEKIWVNFVDTCWHNVNSPGTRSKGSPAAVDNARRR